MKGLCIKHSSAHYYHTSGCGRLFLFETVVVKWFDVVLVQSGVISWEGASSCYRSMYLVSPEKAEMVEWTERYLKFSLGVNFRNRYDMTEVVVYLV